MRPIFVHSLFIDCQFDQHPFFTNQRQTTAFIRTPYLAMSTQQFAKDQPTGFSNRIERVAIVGVCSIRHLSVRHADIK
jgi:hypothetical protein